MKLFITLSTCLTLCLPLFSPSGVFAATTNDPQVKQWGFTDTKTYDAWDITTGSKEVVVAIIDNGFDITHPDLKDNVWKNKNEIADNNKDDDNNGYIDDVWGWNFVIEDTNGNGSIDPEEKVGNNIVLPPVEDLPEEKRYRAALHHGTAVAGIIGSVGNNKKDGSGISQNIQLMNVRVLGNGGSGGLARVAEAIHYAVDNGADIINMSIVSSMQDNALRKALDYAYDNGVSIFAAAGNTSSFLNTSPVYPVCSDAKGDVQKVIGVSAIGVEHYSAFFSNFGSSCVDITAPGVGIASTMRYAPKKGFSKSYGGSWSGTSFATPFVSGAAALIKSIQPTWSPGEVYEALLSTTHKTPPEDEEEYAHLYGKGLLQINKALIYSLARVAPITPLTTIRSFSAQSGFVYYTNPKTGKVEKKIYSLYTKDADQVIQVATNTKPITIAVSQDSPRKYTITTLTKRLRKMQSFSVGTKGKVHVSAGDIYGDSEIEIIVTPLYRSRTLYTVYNTKGDVMFTKKLKTLHKGAVSSVGKDDSKKRHELIVTYNTKEFPVVVRYGRDQEEVKRFTIEVEKNVEALAVGDLNGDSVEDYVFTVGKTTKRKLLLYTRHGTYRKNVIAFPSDKEGVFTTMIGDVTGDGKDNVVTTLEGEGVSQYNVLNHRGRQVRGWRIIDSEENIAFPISLIPVL